MGLSPARTAHTGLPAVPSLEPHITCPLTFSSEGLVAADALPFAVCLMHRLLCCMEASGLLSHVTGRCWQSPHRVAVHGLLSPLLVLAVQASAAVKMPMRVPCCTWQESLWAQASERRRWAGGTRTHSQRPCLPCLWALCHPICAMPGPVICPFPLDCLSFLTDSQTSFVYSQW